jgi:hypothetical protein
VRGLSKVAGVSAALQNLSCGLAGMDSVSALSARILEIYFCPWKIRGAAMRSYVLIFMISGCEDASERLDLVSGVRTSIETNNCKTGTMLVIDALLDLDKIWQKAVAGC